ncbi:hypothetical protein ES703_100101 [subsurface metagenome]
MVEDAIVVGFAAAAGTAVTRLKLSTSTRAKKTLKIFLFNFLTSFGFCGV